MHVEEHRQEDRVGSQRNRGKEKDGGEVSKGQELGVLIGWEAGETRGSNYLTMHIYNCNRKRA